MALAPGKLHAFGHVPQCCASVAVSTQVPPQAVSGAGQLAAHAKPPLVVGAHTGVAPLQLVPHAPQLVAALACASQPFVPLPSQSRRPGAHVSTRHVPDAHEVSALALAHAAPQLAQSLAVLTERSQPSPALPLQSAQPASHTAAPHTPAAHVGAAWTARQGRSQAPQSLSVLVVSTQRVPHITAGATQAATQPVALQSGVAPLHVVAQAPQLVALESDASQPFAGSVSQSSQPAWQLAISHPLAPHRATACARLQLAPQVPQSRVVSSEVSQPSASLPLQSSKFASHVAITHAPVAQLSVA